MFNFFNKPKPVQKDYAEENDDDFLASISYVFKKDSDNTIIDIQIKDYDEESMEALGSLLLTLSRDACFVETINIIKSLLIEDNKTDLLVKLFSKIHNEFKEKINNINNTKISNRPCIKPSEMFSK